LAGRAGAFVLGTPVFSPKPWESFRFFLTSFSIGPTPRYGGRRFPEPSCPKLGVVPDFPFHRSFQELPEGLPNRSLQARLRENIPSLPVLAVNITGILRTRNTQVSSRVNNTRETAVPCVLTSRPPRLRVKTFMALRSNVFPFPFDLKFFFFFFPLLQLRIRTPNPFLTEGSGPCYHGHLGHPPKNPKAPSPLVLGTDRPEMQRFSCFSTKPRYIASLRPFTADMKTKEVWFGQGRERRLSAQHRAGFSQEPTL